MKDACKHDLHDSDALLLFVESVTSINTNIHGANRRAVFQLPH